MKIYELSFTFNFAFDLSYGFVCVFCWGSVNNKLCEIERAEVEKR
jgi:hypothetical protein